MKRNFICNACQYEFKSNEAEPPCPQGCRYPIEKEFLHRNRITTSPLGWKRDPKAEAKAREAKAQAQAKAEKEAEAKLQADKDEAKAKADAEAEKSKNPGSGSKPS